MTHRFWISGSLRTSRCNITLTESHTVADDVEYRLGINEWQARFHPETQVHPNLVILQNLALPPPDKESEVMTRPEPPVADQVTNCDVICVCVCVQ